MLFLKKYFVVIAIVFQVTVYASQSSTLAYSHGQKNCYTPYDMLTTIHNNIQESVIAFDKQQYEQASALATGVLHYMNVMKDSCSRVSLQPTQDIIEQLNYIIAKSNIKTASPQRALSAFKTICDKQTPLGNISSEDIARSLAYKINLLPCGHSLMEKLQTEIVFFEEKISKQRIVFYTKKHDNLSLEESIACIKTACCEEEAEVLELCIARYAAHNNMKALCFLVNAYDKGLYGFTQCQEDTLRFAYRYVALFAGNPTDVPFEQFCIKRVLSGITATPDNMRFYIAHIYFDYLFALRNQKISVAQEALLRLQAINNDASPLRNLVADIGNALINNNFSDTEIIKRIYALEKNKRYEDIIHSFLLTEGAIAKPLLQQHKSHKSICFLLGLLSYCDQDYNAAHDYFNQSKKGTSDIMADWHLLVCGHQINNKNNSDKIKSLMSFAQQMNSLPRKHPHVPIILSSFNNYALLFFSDDVYELLQRKEYSLAQQYTKLLVHNGVSMPHIIDAILQIPDPDTIVTLLQEWITAYLMPISTFLLEYAVKKNSSADTYAKISHIFISLLNNCNSSDKKILLQKIQTCLQNIEKNKIERQKYSKERGEIYYARGKHMDSLSQLDNAIALGHVDALYEKALLLLQQQPFDGKTERMALELLQQHAQSSSDTRHLSLYKLGEFYFDYLVQKPLLRYTKSNSVLSFDYLNKALKAGNKDAYGLLAAYYLVAENNADERPNKQQASLYFKQCTNLDLPCKQEVLFASAMTHLDNGSEKKAWQQFNELDLSSLSAEAQDIVIKKRALLPLYIMAKEEKNGKTCDNVDILYYLIKLWHLCSNKEKSISFTSDILVSFLIQKTTNVMKKKDIDEYDLAMCSMAGVLLHDKHIRTTNNKEDSIKHGAQAMCFAADHGSMQEQLTAGATCSPHISDAQAIKYLLKAYVQSKQQKNIDVYKSSTIKLEKRVPNTLREQYVIFKQYLQNNDVDTATLYLENIQAIQPTLKFDSDIDSTERDNLLHDCHNNDFLKAMADKVLQAPHAAKDSEQGAAFLRAGILFYSKDKTDLLLSVKYLNALSGTFNTVCRTFLLGLVYYELSSIFEQENVPALQTAYLKKSIEYGCPHAMAKAKGPKSLIPLRRFVPASQRQ